MQVEQLREHLGTSNQTISGLKSQIDDLHAQLQKREDELEQQAQEHLQQMEQLQRQLDAAQEDSAAPHFMATTRLVRWLPSGRCFSAASTQYPSAQPPPYLMCGRPLAIHDCVCTALPIWPCRLQEHNTLRLLWLGNVGCQSPALVPAFLSCGCVHRLCYAEGAAIWLRARPGLMCLPVH